MQFVNLNVEGDKHITRVFQYLDTVRPAILTLQEAPFLFKVELEERGYQVTFAPLTLRSRLPEASYQEGVMLPTKEPHEAVIHHYHDTGNELTFFDKARYRETMRKQRYKATTRSARCNHCPFSKWVRAKVSISPQFERSESCGSEQANYFACVRDSKAAAMFTSEAGSRVLTRIRA